VASAPQSLNKYLYTLANPVNGNDPSGQFDATLAGLLVGTSIRLALTGLSAGIIINGINNYALGKPFFDGWKGAAAFGAAALPIAVAFPILGMVLAGLGIYTAGVTGYQVFTNNSSDSQKGAAVFLIGLSLFGAYGSINSAAKNGLWVNANFTGAKGVVPAATASADMTAAIEYTRMRVGAFSAVLETMPKPQQNGITIAVGIADDANGNRFTLIGTSEPNGNIRGPMRPLIQGNDIVIRGGKGNHAESDIVRYCEENSLTLKCIGATRDICPQCATEIAEVGGTAVVTNYSTAASSFMQYPVPNSPNVLEIDSGPIGAGGDF
jgi:hypothetical protein